MKYYWRLLTVKYETLQRKESNVFLSKGEVPQKTPTSCLLSLRFKAAVLWPFHGIFSFLTNSYRLSRRLFLPVLPPWLFLSLSFFTSNGAPYTIAKIWILFTRNIKHYKIQHFSRRGSKASKTFKRFFRFSFALQRAVIVIFFNREGLAEEMLPIAS